MKLVSGTELLLKSHRSVVVKLLSRLRCLLFLYFKRQCSVFVDLSLLTNLAEEPARSRTQPLAGVDYGKVD
jgi:hypothetical protein